MTGWQRVKPLLTILAGVTYTAVLVTVAVLHLYGPTVPLIAAFGAVIVLFQTINYTIDFHRAGMRRLARMRAVPLS